MFTNFPHLKGVAIGVVAAGVLAVGLAGIASASPSVAPTTATHALSTPRSLRHFDVGRFNCADATKALTRIAKVEAHVAAGLPKLTAAQAQAIRNGHPVRARRLERRISRLQSATFGARLTRVSAAIEAKCRVSAPAVRGGTNA
jgi:hypothetical protein